LNRKLGPILTCFINQLSTVNENGYSTICNYTRSVWKCNVRCASCATTSISRTIRSTSLFVPTAASILCSSKFQVRFYIFNAQYHCCKSIPYFNTVQLGNLSLHLLFTMERLQRTNHHHILLLFPLPH